MDEIEFVLLFFIIVRSLGLKLAYDTPPTLFVFLLSLLLQILLVLS